MKKITLLTLSFLAAALMGLTAEDVKPVNTVCPISGEDIDAEQVVTYTKVVGLCCEKCQAKLQKDVAGNVDKLKDVKAVYVNTKCPVSGEDVDAEVTVDFKGAKVALCCEKCQAKFDAEKHGEKVVMDHAGNEKCVFSGKDIDAEATTVVSIPVAFCCGKCVKKFKEAPEETIGKVEFDKADAPAEGAALGGAAAGALIGGAVDSKE